MHVDLKEIIFVSAFFFLIHFVIMDRNRLKWVHLKGHNSKQFSTCVNFLKPVCLGHRCRFALYKIIIINYIFVRTFILSILMK